MQPQPIQPAPGPTRRRGFLRMAALLAGLLLLAAGPAQAQDVVGSTQLTDKIYKGSGTLDLMKDLTGSGLEQVIQGGTLFLGVDLNESASPPESSDSAGVAIKSIRLTLTTTAGTYTFTDFFTSTTALIQEAGTTQAQEFYTLFGHAGSNQITGGTDGSLTGFDDVIYLQDIVFEGQIVGATMQVTFLTTDPKGGTNEAFFDYSGGFEDFAVLTVQDAQVVEAAQVGVDTAPSTVTYSTDTQAVEQVYAALAPPPPASSGAPAPPLAALAVLGVLLLGRRRVGA